MEGEETEAEALMPRESLASGRSGETLVGREIGARQEELQMS